MRHFFFITAFILFNSLCLFGEVSPYTVKLNEKVSKLLPFDNTEDFKDASRGLIAPLPDKGIIKNLKGDVIWNLDAYKFLTTDQPDDSSTAPETVNPSLWRQARLLKIAGLFKVTENIYQIRSADLSNMTIIEGKTGLIIVDTLFSKETAEAALALYYQNRPIKPIKAVIYTHSHVDHFGGIKGLITQQQADNGDVKVIAPKGFTEASLDENIMVGNAMGRRAMYMYGSLLRPGTKGQVSTGLGLTTSKGEVTLILPTHFISKTGEEMIIDGVKFVFLMAPNSEAPSEMLFFLPELKALCAAEDATHNMHNLYTLRGAKIRDAKAWANYLNEAIELFGPQSECVFAQHHWPKWGNKKVTDFLEKQRDMYKYIHDQTLHLANKGYHMAEIAERITMPSSLAKEWYNRGYYGSLNHNVKSVYNYYLGWFNGNPSTLHELPDTEASKKHIEYMGGAEAVLKKAQTDYANGEYRWVAQVLNYLVYADPKNKQAKNLLANTLEQLGYQSENGTWRNFYLTGAQELREGIQKDQFTGLASLDMIIAMSTESFFDYLSIKLDGLKASENPMTINFNLPDKNEKYIVQIKNGVLHYYSNRNSESAELTIELNRSEMNRLIVGETNMKDLIESKKLVSQGKIELMQKFLSLFDDFNPWFNIVEPQ